MSFEMRELRPGEAADLMRLACPNFSMVEQIFMSRPKLGVVAEAEDGSVAGGAFLIIVEAGGRKVGCIDIIFVLPKYRGSGVAKQLYHAATEQLHQRGCDTVMALVRGDNSQSLRRFEAEGLCSISLHRLRKQIGFSATAGLFIKTASLACATGCWILCENAAPQSVGSNVQNLLRTFLTNGVLLLCGALLGSCLHTGSAPWWNLLAALFFLAVLTLGESLGRKAVGGSWRFVLPEGGLVPTAIVALLGGFYPMLGHWYLTERENTPEYRRHMAAPAMGAWLTLMAAVFACGLLRKAHPFFGCGADLGVMLLVFYILPFYPFDSFGGRRVREHNERTYAALITFSIITLGCVVGRILAPVAAALGSGI